MVVPKQSTKGDCFRNKVHEHRHELGFASAAPAHVCVQSAEDQASDAECGSKSDCWQNRHCLWNQCERNCRSQYPAPERNNSVYQLTFLFCVGCSFELSAKRACERGDACKPRHHNYDYQFGHLLSLFRTPRFSGAESVRWKRWLWDWRFLNVFNNHYSSSDNRHNCGYPGGFFC